MDQILIVIPSYEPDRRLLALLKDIKENGVGFVILVDDGSGLEYADIFGEAGDIMGDGGIILSHDANKGKGRALKTAFEYVLEHCPDAKGVVTADSDGQHTADAIREIKGILLEKPDNLVLGVRNFGEEGIPWKSKFGNTLTEKIFGYLAGVHVSDTQTGLRGIPKSLLQPLLKVKGERFEFEMRMLLEITGKCEITEVPIDTIYDSEENHQTHFHPLKDSIRIYRILAEKFIKYTFVSFSSSVIDITLFSVMCFFLKRGHPHIYIAIATVAARIFSSLYNYLMNYKVVFRSEEKIKTAGMRYAFLAVMQMGMSAILVTIFASLLSVIPEFVIKTVVDVALFFLSYHIQRRYVF